MVLLDGLGRSGTSLLGRITASMLESEGFTYLYEPFHHPSPVGTFENWQAMIRRVLAPGDADSELTDYLLRMERVGGGKVFWKEIRLALKQDWLLDRFPDLQIIHLTRDIMGVLSSHRREDAPDWMRQHRKIWGDALDEWFRQRVALKSKGVEFNWDPADLDELERYAALWAINERFVLGLNSERLVRVRYEDLCVHPNETLTRIAAFLKVALKADHLERLVGMMREPNEGVDPSGAWMAASPASMIEIWRERLSRVEMLAIDRVAAECRRAWGYPSVSSQE